MIKETDNMQKKVLVKGIRHTGIYVRNLEMMVCFYRDLFELKVVVHQQEKGLYTDTIFNEGNIGIQVCKLEFKNKTMIELIQFGHIEAQPDWSEKIYRCGKMHIAITVDSAMEIYRRLKERNCEVLSEPCDSPDGKAKVFFARDPEGNYLELVEEL